MAVPPNRRSTTTAWGDFDAESLRDDLFAIVERAAVLFGIAVVSVIVIWLAVVVTPIITRVLLSLPRLATDNLGRLIATIRQQPWEHWIVFPFVLAFIGLAAWYWLESESRKENRPTRGRSILTGDQARRSAVRQLQQPKSKPPKRRRQF